MIPQGRHAVTVGLILRGTRKVSGRSERLAANEYYLLKKSQS